MHTIIEPFKIKAGEPNTGQRGKLGSGEAGKQGGE
jgi:hypothetical protein